MQFSNFNNYLDSLSCNYSKLLQLTDLLWDRAKYTVKEPNNSQKAETSIHYSKVIVIFRLI